MEPAPQCQPDAVGDIMVFTAHTAAHPHGASHQSDVYQGFNLRIQQQQQRHIGKGASTDQLHWALRQVGAVVLMDALIHDDGGLAGQRLPVAVRQDGPAMWAVQACPADNSVPARACGRLQVTEEDEMLPQLRWHPHTAHVGLQCLCHVEEVRQWLYQQCGGAPDTAKLH